MKKLMLIMALGGISIVANAQYNSAMDNNVILNDRGIDNTYSIIRLNTGSNNQENPNMTSESSLNVNSMDVFEGYRNLPDPNQVNTPAAPVLVNTNGVPLVNTAPPPQTIKMNAVGQYQGNRITTKKKLAGKTSGLKVDTKEPAPIQIYYPVGTPPANSGKANRIDIWYYE